MKEMRGARVGFPVHLCLCLMLRGWVHMSLLVHTYDTANILRALIANLPS